VHSATTTRKKTAVHYSIRYSHFSGEIRESASPAGRRNEASARSPGKETGYRLEPVPAWIRIGFKHLPLGPFAAERRIENQTAKGSSALPWARLAIASTHESFNDPHNAAVNPAVQQSKGPRTAQRTRSNHAVCGHCEARHCQPPLLLCLVNARGFSISPTPKMLYDLWECSIPPTPCGQKRREGTDSG
jgi:hypothetical protein